MDNKRVVETSHYRVPDTAAMRVAKDRLNMNVAGAEFDFLPSLHDKLASVGSELNDAHQQLFDDIKKVDASLANTGLVDTLVRIQEIQGNAQLPSSLKGEQTDSLLKYGTERAIGSYTLVATAKRYLVSVVQAFESISFADFAGNLPHVLGGEVSAIERRIDVDQGDLEKLAVEKQFIDDAIQKFKAPGWRDILNSLLPSAEEIEAAIKLVTLNKPDKEFLKMVLNKLQGNLDGIDQGLQFSDLAKARDGVRERISTLNANIQSDGLQVRELQRKLRALEELDTLAPVIRSWSDQVAKVAEAYSHFLQANGPESITDVLALKATSERYEALLSYLRTIKKS